jgi:hypothetical protein
LNKSIYDKYRPYRPISIESEVIATDIKVTAADTKVIATDTNQKGIKGICLYKQEMHIKNSSKTIVTPPSAPLKQKQIFPKLILNLLIYKRNTL